MSKNLNIWIEGTIIAALATVLSLIPFNIGPSFSVTVGAPVMMLYCLRRGLVPGFFASFPVGRAAHPDRNSLYPDAVARIHRVLHRLRFHRLGRSVHAESPTSDR